jgi:hypothetical protein
MLAGDPAPAIKGAVHALRIQTKAEGWMLDDPVWGRGWTLRIA